MCGDRAAGRLHAKTGLFGAHFRAMRAVLLVAAVLLVLAAAAGAAKKGDGKARKGDRTPRTAAAAPPVRALFFFLLENQIRPKSGLKLVVEVVVYISCFRTSFLLARE